LNIKNVVKIILKMKEKTYFFIIAKVLKNIILYLRLVCSYFRTYM